MYKFMNNPYVRMPFFEADKGGGAGGSGEDGNNAGEGDDPDEDDSDETEEEEQEEKKFSQKDIDEAVKKRLAREKRKWQRDQQKQSATGGVKKETDSDPDNEGDAEADKKARKAEEKAAALEMKWTCLEHDVKKDCVDDVLALAKVNMAKDEDMDIEDAIDAVLKKYPQFKDGYEDEGSDDQERKGWGQRHGKPPKKENTVEDEIRKQMFGK
ncbi:hypothetical protein [Diplocloster agilis]|uniref:Uncharacterized protein n=1 Tax=Diplocloster agilis TaxID=2850323 RepID=A0A949K8T0_9FIRM|nr:hypothetical protein [Diplocloster agilis]MBU9739333.1 hypothetical protein [Diplocloster agilis]